MKPVPEKSPTDDVRDLAKDDADALAEFEPVEFKRGEWRAFETYATDFLTGTAALPGAVVGTYARVRAALWAYGSGWSLCTDPETWVTHAGAEDVPALMKSLEQLEDRGLLLVVDKDGKLTIADPSQHRELGRKQRERERYHKRSSLGNSSRNSNRKSTRSFHENSEGGRRKEEGGKSGGDQPPCERSVDVRHVLDHYRIYHPRALPNPQPESSEWRLVLDRLAEGFSVAELKLAIDGNHLSPFHAGQNEGGSKFQRLKHSLGSADVVTECIERAQATSAAKASPPTKDYLDVRNQPLSASR